MSRRPLRIIQYGLGPIGRATARALLGRQELRLVGAVDRDPALIGVDVGRLLGSRQPLGLKVEATVDRLLRRGRADLLLHTTVSRLRDAVPQIAPVLLAGLDVVSSTEELTYPWRSAPTLARRLDSLARAGGATVHGTGVNPGFVMDVLPLVLTHAAVEVRGVRIHRTVDAASRREALRRKVGAGLTPAAFRALARQGAIGHVGLRQSMDLLAAGLGLRIDRTVHRLQPVLATRALAGPPRVRRGEVAGQRETLVGFEGRTERLRLELVIALGVRKPGDRIVVRGRPPLTLCIDGGTPGDEATAAALLNAAPRVHAAEPGLQTALDLPLPRAGSTAASAAGRSRRG